MISFKNSNKKWLVPLLLLLLNIFLFALMAPFFNAKKNQEIYLHANSQEKYIDRSSDIVNWGYALFKIFKDNVKPNNR